MANDLTSPSKPYQDKTITMTMQQAVFTNLCLLGMDPDAIKAEQRVSISPDMFRATNKKAMEVILKFLFDKLNARQSASAFKFCWPILDRKQETMFRRAAGEWIMRIRESNPGIGISSTVHTVLLSPAGHKMYSLLLKLSSFILRKELVVYSLDDDTTIFPKYDTEQMLKSGQVSEIQLKAMRLHIKRLCSRFLERSCKSVSLQHLWRSTAVHTVRAFRLLEKEQRDATGRIASLSSAGNVPWGITNMDFNEVLATRAERVRTLWNDFESVFCSTTQERKLLSQVFFVSAETVIKSDLFNLSYNHQIIDEDAKSLVLDANEVNLKPPIEVIRAAELQTGTQDTYVGGKLNLPGLFQLWHTGLKILVDKFEEHVLVNSGEKAEEVSTELYRHKKNLNSVQEVLSKIPTSKLEELDLSVNKLSQSVEQLHASCRMPEDGSNATELTDPHILPKTRNVAPIIQEQITENSKYDLSASVESGAGEIASEDPTGETNQHHVQSSLDVRLSSKTAIPNTQNGNTHFRVENRSCHRNVGGFSFTPSPHRTMQPMMEKVYISEPPAVSELKLAALDAESSHTDLSDSPEATEADESEFSDVENGSPTISSISEAINSGNWSPRRFLPNGFASPARTNGQSLVGVSGDVDLLILKERLERVKQSSLEGIKSTESVHNNDSIAASWMPKSETRRKVSAQSMRSSKSSSDLSDLKARLERQKQQYQQ